MLKLTNQEIRENMREFCPDWERTVEECLAEGKMELLIMIIDNEIRFMEMIIEDGEDFDKLEENVGRGIKMETFYNQLKAQFPSARIA